MVNYKEYPHDSFGLPTEKRIVGLAEKENWDLMKVLNTVRKGYNGKAGLEEHVKEILERRKSQ